MTKRPKARSAIVPGVVFSMALATAAGVVPNIVGCSDDTEQQQGGGLDVAFSAFDMARARDLSVPGLDVANVGFDMANRD